MVLSLQWPNITTFPWDASLPSNSKSLQPYKTLRDSAIDQSKNTTHFPNWKNVYVWPSCRLLKEEIPDFCSTTLALLIHVIILFPNVYKFVDHLVVEVFLTNNLVHFLLVGFYHTFHTRHEKKWGTFLCCIYEWGSACLNVDLSLKTIWHGLKGYHISPSVQFCGTRENGIQKKSLQDVEVSNPYP